MKYEELSSDVKSCVNVVIRHFVSAVHDSDIVGSEQIMGACLEELLRELEVMGGGPDDGWHIELDQATDSKGNECHGVYIYGPNNYCEVITWG
jgi:hypothetical protein